VKSVHKNTATNTVTGDVPAKNIEANSAYYVLCINAVIAPITFLQASPDRPSG
jgi:hypothetical protein